MSDQPSLSKSKTLPLMIPSSHGIGPCSRARPVASLPGRSNVSGDFPLLKRTSASSLEEPTSQCLTSVVTRSNFPSLSRSAQIAAPLLPPSRAGSRSVAWFHRNASLGTLHGMLAGAATPAQPVSAGLSLHQQRAD